MRTIERASQFKKDYKRVKSNPRYRKVVDTLLSEVLNLLGVTRLDHILFVFKGFQYVTP